MVERLRVKIDLPAFQLEIATEHPVEALTELRKILETLQQDDQVLYEEYAVQEMKSKFSSHFIANQQIMGVIRDLLKREENYTVQAIDIPSTATIDLEQHTKEQHVEKHDVQRAIGTLTGKVDTKGIKQGIIHVSGNLDRPSKLLILDHIHRNMPTAQLRAFHSEGEDNRVVVECVFFGDFEDEE